MKLILYVFAFCLADNGDCLYLAKKHKCNNRNRQSLRRRMSHSNHNCELMYLPLVHVASEPAHQNQDLLECQSNMTGFEPSCPGLRARSLTNHMQCDPLLLNTNKCDTTSYVRTRCPFMQTCDHVSVEKKKSINEIYELDFAVWNYDILKFLLVKAPICIKKTDGSKISRK